MKDKNRMQGGFRKKESESSPNDFYPTPKYLVWKLLELPFFKNLDTGNVILEPCYGEGAISDEFKKLGYNVIEHDIAKDGIDFLSETFDKGDSDIIVTNPPFKLFVPFVEKSKKLCNHVWMIGKTNFFGAHQRNADGLWEHLEELYIFDRQVDYQSSASPDGKFKTGMLVTGWFHWNKDWNENYTKLRIIDVQDGVISSREK